MTSRTHIEAAVRSLWAARQSGDLEAMMKLLGDNAEYEMNGRGTGVPAMANPSTGKPAIRSVFRQLLETWRFDDWREVSLVVEGEKAFLHWRARATCVPTNKSGDFDVFDVFTFDKDVIVEMRESTDTALIVALATP